tara:strand:- start:425 stop:631 length:207 start_codon:yes stop_codon:yes gene_type:complete
MAVAHTTVLELLGKQVSFVYFIESSSGVYSLSYSGTVLDVIVSLSGEHQISIGSDFYSLSDLRDFCVN